MGEKVAAKLKELRDPYRPSRLRAVERTFWARNRLPEPAPGVGLLLSDAPATDTPIVALDIREKDYHSNGKSVPQP